MSDGKGDSKQAPGYREQQVADLCATCNVRLVPGDGRPPSPSASDDSESSSSSSGDDDKASKPGRRCAHCQRPYCLEHLPERVCEACAPVVQRNLFANVAFGGAMVAVLLCVLALLALLPSQGMLYAAMAGAYALALVYGVLGLRSQHRGRAALALASPLAFGALLLLL